MTSRNYRSDAALRPQPTRIGPDDWATPPCLATALVRDVLPTLPVGTIWEPAPGAGALVRAMQAAHLDVITCRSGFNFLADEAPSGDIAVIATNPPFNAIAAFTQRGLELLDGGKVEAFVLLFRHDHLQSESRHPPHGRLDALRRASRYWSAHGDRDGSPTPQRRRAGPFHG